jgi:hypothetical protein
MIGAPQRDVRRAARLLFALNAPQHGVPPAESDWIHVAVAEAIPQRRKTGPAGEG